MCQAGSESLRKLEHVCFAIEKRFCEGVPKKRIGGKKKDFRIVLEVERLKETKINLSFINL